MPKRSTRDNDIYRIGHMIEFCEKLMIIAERATIEVLEDDWIMMYALMELLQLLGEASSKVGDELKEKTPSIPWRRATLLRNRLIHGYDDIDYERVIETLENDVPPLLENLRALHQQIKIGG